MARTHEQVLADALKDPEVLKAYLEEMEGERRALQQEVERLKADKETLNENWRNVHIYESGQINDLSAALAAMAEALKLAAPLMGHENDCPVVWQDEEGNSFLDYSLCTCPNKTVQQTLADPTTTAAYAAARQAQDVVQRLREWHLLIGELHWFESENGYLPENCPLCSLNGPDGEQAGL